MGIQSGEIIIPDHVVKEVENYLLPDENWQAILQPYRIRIFFSIPGINISLPMWVVFAMFLVGTIMANPFSTTSSLDMIRVFLAFVCVIIMMFLLVLWWLYAHAHRVIYAITNQRLIIIIPNLFSSSIKSYGRRDINQLRVKAKQDGSGDLYFVKVGAGGYLSEIGFLGIPDVYAVRQMIIEVFEFESDDFWV